MRHGSHGHRGFRGGDDDQRLSLLNRWGALVARHGWIAVGIWAVILTVAGCLYPMLQRELSTPSYTIAGSQSDQAQELLGEHFPALGNEQGVLVFTAAGTGARSTAYRAAVAGVLEKVRALPGITGVVDPYTEGGISRIGDDGRTAVALIGMRGDASERADLSDDISTAATAAASGTGVEALYSGSTPLNKDLSEVELHDQERAEMIGIPVALAVLLLASGALVAALLPVVTALLGVLLCMGVLALVAPVFGLDQFVTVIASMIGVGVGIDYGLFVVSRFREELAHRIPEASTRRERKCIVSGAVGQALHTSGRTVLASGIIVMVALCSMVVIRGHVFQQIALGTGIVVTCSLLVSLTLLPAILGLLGTRVEKLALPRRMRPQDTVGGGGGDPMTTFWGRWARMVMRRPWLCAGASIVLLVVMALPLGGIKLGLDLGLNALGKTESGRAQQIVAGTFTPGAVAPVQIVIDAGAGGITTADLNAVAALGDSLRANSSVAEIVSPTEALDQAAGRHDAPALRAAARDAALRTDLGQLVDLDTGGRHLLLTVVADVPIDSVGAMQLVRDLRNDILPGALAGTGATFLVGGLTAQYVDLSDETTAKLPLVISIVLGLSFLYLLVVFRSILLPLKAAVMNLLATCAALGLTVFVFQEGHGESLLGFSNVGTLQAYLPVTLFALLFGLSMDYEVFLVGRMKEEWDRSHDHVVTVATALSHTGRQITAAAAIMMVVFGSFLVADVLELKQMGFALAVAVTLDATVIRMVLVPAVMTLAGKWNWWLPGPLERAIPKVHLE
ncbi:MMPL family transporter [Kineosporia mesophila]|uniref:MMPL family transporter n=2 Tax=Kineosporia mesophila TaxID=566012 RepID=A0ABP7AU04_9ACTN